jgi:hypothetical protein
VIPGAYD